MVQMIHLGEKWNGAHEKCVQSLEGTNGRKIKSACLTWYMDVHITRFIWGKYYMGFPKTNW